MTPSHEKRLIELVEALEEKAKKLLGNSNNDILIMCDIKYLTGYIQALKKEK